MVRLPEQELTSEQLEALFEQLHSRLGALNATNTAVFLKELLGPEERIMLAKRFATIVLLLEGYSQYKTAQMLNISQSTAKKVAKQINDGSYEGIIRILGKNKRDYFAILDTLDSILHLGGILPHYNGLDRY